jgi:alanyl-tRNA synthetase
MNELESIDVYHLSGSLQKKGFEVQKFLTALPEVERSTNENIVRIQGNTTIKPTINPPVAFLNEKRVWTCGLFGGKVATIPCGGTHAAEINPQNKIIAKFERTGNADFVVRSRIIQ